MTGTKVVGHRTLRQDALAKATGAYCYGMDFQIPGQLFGAILRSPHAHALIRSIDASRARSLAGVEVVLTADDLPADLLMPGVVWDQPLLASDRARYHGEPVAAVAARSPEIAQQALELIAVDYHPLPALVDAEAAMAEEAPLVHEAWESYKAEEGLVRNRNICCQASLHKGDAEKAFASAEVIVEGIYTTESVHQSHLEPRVATAVVLPGQVPTVYTNTQLPYWIRTNVAHVLGVPEEEVRIVPTGIGGAFGSKLYPQIEPLTSLLSPSQEACASGCPSERRAHRRPAAAPDEDLHEERRDAGRHTGLASGEDDHGWRGLRWLDTGDRLGGRALPGRALPHTQCQGRCLRRSNQQDQLRRLPRSGWAAKRVCSGDASR
jgi:CO/xanthine dehydrogenase Mo-binding subunit